MPTIFWDWALSVLGRLGAEPHRQAEWLRASRVGADELVLELEDVLHVARARVCDGSVDEEVLRLLQSVAVRADALGSCPEDVWSEAALAEAAEWGELRAAARAAGTALERRRSWSGPAT